MPYREEEQQHERLLSISPMSDVGSHWLQSDIASPMKPAQDYLPSRGLCAPTDFVAVDSLSGNGDSSGGGGGGFRLLHGRLVCLHSSRALPLFGVILETGTAERDDRCQGASFTPPISWGTAAMLARHAYLHDVVLSSASSVVLLQSFAPSAATARAERHSPPPVATAWEKLLCAVLFCTSPHEQAVFRRAISWKEHCHVEETVTTVRRWTRVLEEGFLRWVPPSSGLRLLLLLRKVGGDVNGICCGSLEMALLGLDDVRLVQQHWALLRRHWLVSEDSVSLASIGDDLPESLDRTARVFQRHYRQALHTCMDDTGNDGSRSCSRTQIARVMAVVAHIEAHLQMKLPNADKRVVHSSCHEDCASGCLPFTAMQRDYLIEILAFLFHSQRDGAQEEGRSAAVRWVWTQLGDDSNVSLFSGPSRVLFHEFLASLAHWLVLQVLPVLLHRVNLAASQELQGHAALCSDWSAHDAGNDNAAMSSSPGTICRSLRLQFQRVNTGAENTADSLRPGAPVAATLLSSSSSLVATSPCNLLSGVTMSGWVRWLWSKNRRNERRHLGRETDMRSGGTTHWPAFFPSLSSRGVALLSILDTLEPLGPAVASAATTAELSDKFFDSCGTPHVAVNRWVLGCSSAEVAALCQQQQLQRCRFSPHVSPHRALELFTLMTFILRYRPMVDAARIAHVASHFCQKGKEATAGGEEDAAWRPLPPLFHISLVNFNLFLPTNQAKLICSAAGVDYTVYASTAEEEEEEEEQCQRCAVSRGDADIIDDEMTMTSTAGRAAPVALMEDSGLVKVYDCVALERLEVARWRGRERLHACGTLILQAFLRARWSVRWNFIPLRRRAERRFVVILQAVLRAHWAMLTVTQRLKRLLMQRQRWLEERRRSAATRESLVRTLESHAEPRAVDADRGDSNGSKEDETLCSLLIPETRASVSSLLTPRYGHYCGSGGANTGHEQLLTAPVLHDGNTTNGGEDADVDAGHSGCTLLTALLAMEAKGRNVVQHVETKGRRELLVCMEAEGRKCLLLREYRDRRLTIQQCREERNQALLHDGRRLRWKQMQKRQMKQERIQSHLAPTKRGKETRRTPSASSASLRDNQSGSIPRGVTTCVDGGNDLSDVLVVIDMQDDDCEEMLEGKKRDLPIWAKKRCQPGNLAAPVGKRRETRGMRSLHSGVAASVSVAKPAVEAPRNRPMMELWRREYEDRTFIELSEQYNRCVLQRRCALECFALTEMLQRRIIFLAGMLEWQELLARWRTIIVPYCLVTEALYSDLLVAMVVLQDAAPQHHRRAVSRLPRGRQVNLAPEGAASACARGQRSQLLSQRRQSNVPAENEKTRRFTASVKIAAMQREFLKKPRFHLLSRNSTDSNPAHSRDGAAAEIRRNSVAAEAEAVLVGPERAKAPPPRVRKRLITWADSPPPPSSSA